ncbi:MAG: hypothetical protein GC190_19340 [Alphaproteobacteria bacterium]|nr:hypothetical protein [Alphaproteobacteria bacterium]
MAVYPNVPNVPGVPPVNRQPGTSSASPTLAKSDSPAIQNSAGKPKWGIYKDGALALEVDSIISLDFGQEYIIADYPIERGGFESYDKVNSPFDITLRVSKSGSPQDRAAFIQALDKITASMDLLAILSPEKTYPSVNVRRLDYRRTAQEGAGRIVADLPFVEIRETGEAAFVDTKSPAGAKTKNNGTVQPVVVSDGNRRSVSDIINTGDGGW